MPKSARCLVHYHRLRAEAGLMDCIYPDTLAILPRGWMQDTWGSIFRSAKPPKLPLTWTGGVETKPVEASAAMILVKYRAVRRLLTPLLQNARWSHCRHKGGCFSAQYVSGNLHLQRVLDQSQGEFIALRGSGHGIMSINSHSPAPSFILGSNCAIL